ncbi:recombination mediator RecR [Ectothiorhodospira lacustris]|uniref:recombination mediator RecR n=1 Tax=Ectothiorhodospira lacustris TaxID=2899127 RepID=UPI001EE8DB28|nr:recombination mediator RecR [Ectothiorhodospira lacustris]MCG5500545.1 recombination mediator RecR [Ectothiorhodospira lacustris]MCG5509382.1 recombination mediator RecR [Ectothiorhodospira lacustris]MCG5521436.1 recombination mediator RecR [Ectothiorhodospira lacustris]
MDGAPLLDRLVEALRCLPGVGPKSAQRMALHVLERDREGALRLSELLKQAAERIGHCRRCRTLTEDELCRVCADTRRDPGSVCVVETPADLLAIEQATGFRGQYHVLLGQLSPLDGIGPEELGLDRLEARLAEGEIRELILATGTTVEGEVTAHYIADMARACGVRATRIAHGIPLGGELEYVDRGTLSHAFSGRRDL